MTCLHYHDQILEFLWKIFLKGFQIYQNYLCALSQTPIWAHTVSMKIVVYSTMYYCFHIFEALNDNFEA